MFNTNCHPYLAIFKGIRVQTMFGVMCLANNGPEMFLECFQVRHGDVQYMALCMVKDFFVFPIFSAGFKLQQEPIELRRPPRALSGPSVCVYNNFLYCCGGIHDQSAPHISSARCFRWVQK